MRIWLNGAFVDPKKACIATNDRGFLLGDGLFETMLFRESVIVGFSSHMDRMRDAASKLELPIPYDDSQIADAARNLISLQKLEQERASLRLTVSRGEGSRGLQFPETPQPTCMMTVAPAAIASRQMTAIIGTIKRNEFSPLSRLKTLNYLDNILAKREADLAGADEAIMLNTKDCVACASTANVFVIRGDQVVTPPIEDGVLPGITRATILRIAEEQEISCAEETISRDDLMGADAVFLSNSLIGLRAISMLGTKVFQAHSLLEHLQRLYEVYLDHMSASSVTGR